MLQQVFTAIQLLRSFTGSAGIGVSARVRMFPVGIIFGFRTGLPPVAYLFGTYGIVSVQVLADMPNLALAISISVSTLRKIKQAQQSQKHLQQSQDWSRLTLLFFYCANTGIVL